MRKNERRHILVIDIGGGHVKFCVSNRHTAEQFVSGPGMSPAHMVGKVLAATRAWHYSHVTIGFPGMIIDGRIVCEPANLGHGWVAFDFAKAFGRPARLMNDAAMQALGSYAGGRMLFLGFGTGLGAVLIADSAIHPMELAHLPFSKRGLIQNFVGDDARRRLGTSRWSKHAKVMIKQLSRALDADSIVIGGGNATRLKRLPRHATRGGNELAFVGGIRAWRGNWAP
jgi:predicted NBD/HSP70 family sugar kinase